jgi:hypothetical protein
MLPTGQDLMAAMVIMLDIAEIVPVVKAEAVKALRMKMP